MKQKKPWKKLGSFLFFLKGRRRKPGSNRGSKKLLKTDNQLHSSTIAVLGNDDLLIEILLRLPLLSLHLFKLVSKHWLSLIRSPDFTLSRKKIPKIDPPAGLFIQLNFFERYKLRIEHDCMSFDIRIPSKRSIVFPSASDAPYGDVRIFQSCNGLLLCGSIHFHPGEFYVCNPTIELFKRLPPPTKSNVTCSLQLAFDPTKSPHYKVFALYVQYDEFGCIDHCQIETYSSETGNWSLYGDRFPVYTFFKFESAIYWNDSFHWLMYPPYCHCNLKIVNEHMVLTKTEPPRTFPGKLFESGGSLLCVCENIIDTDPRKFTVFEMKNGCSDWSIKYIVHVNDFNIMVNVWRIYENVCAIVLGQREEDSYMLIEISTKIVQYYPMLKTLRTLYDSEATSFKAYPFIPSLAGV